MTRVLAGDDNTVKGLADTLQARRSYGYARQQWLHRLSQGGPPARQKLRPIGPSSSNGDSTACRSSAQAVHADGTDRGL